MALPKYTEPHYRIWHYVYLSICAAVFFFLIAPLFVILPLSFNAEQYIHFSAKMLALDPEGFSLRWYEDMIYGTKNPWGLAAKNSFIIAIFATIGAVILGTPFVVITVTATLSGFDHSVTRAAASLGSNPVNTFMKITLPLILPGVISGGLFAFVTSFDEVVVVLFLAGLENTTIPIQMWTGLREQLSPTILAVATCLILLSTLILISAELLRRRSERLRGINR